MKTVRVMISDEQGVVSDAACQGQNTQEAFLRCLVANYNHEGSKQSPKLALVELDKNGRIAWFAKWEAKHGIPLQLQMEVLDFINWLTPCGEVRPGPRLALIGKEARRLTRKINKARAK